jgi:8-hydroxy-5-deazaflavin:NADPH oxidoreductase
MKVSILGTGMVGQAIAGKMTAMGHEVYMGSRNAENAKSNTKPNPMTGVSFADWFNKNHSVNVVDYNELPSDSDIFINATNGKGSVDALNATGKEKLKGKIILDIANPLDFSQGMPPSLYICNTDSLGEKIQREFPESKVVKSLNTMNCYLMMDPSLVPGNHTVFISGNDETAKQEIKSWLMSVGWENSNIIDLGDLSTARGTEMLLPIWLRLYGVLGTVDFNFHIARR